MNRQATKAIASALMVAVASGPARAQAVIRASGTAERSVPAELARVTATFTVMAPTRAEAAARLLRTMDSVRAGLVALGVPRDSIFAGSAVLAGAGAVITPIPGPVHFVQAPGDPIYRPTRQLQDTSYRAADGVELHVHEFARLGSVVDFVYALGANSLSPITFTARNTAHAEDEAIREATQNARRKATAMADAAGLALGSLSTLTNAPAARDTQGPARVERDAPLAAGGRGGRATGTLIVPPAVTVRATVDGVWFAEPKKP